MSGSTRLPAKLLIFGEHSIFAGSRAIGLPYPRYSDISIDFLSQTDALHFCLNGRLLDPASPDYALLANLWQQAVDLTGRYVCARGLQVNLQSRVPVSAGLGSSAVLCSLIASALVKQADGSPGRVWEVANALEQRFHKTPSGIDTGIVLSGEPSVFVAGNNGRLPGREPFADPQLPLVVAAVPREKSTVQLIADVRRHTGGPTVEALVREVEAGIDELLASGPWPTWGEPARRAFGSRLLRTHELLCDMGAGSEVQNSILRRALELGALGGKLSGAGGGGCLFVLARDLKAATGLAADLREWCNSQSIDLPLAPELMLPE